MIDLNKMFIEPEKCTLNCLLAMNYSPKRLKLKHTSRAGSSLLYVVHGTYHYKCKDGDFFLKEKDLLYLPQGAAYSLEILSKKTYSLQIEFELFTQNENMKENIVLNNHPTVVAQNCGAEIEMLFYDIIKGYKSKLFSLKLASDSSLSRLMAITFESLYNKPENKNISNSKIGPAVDFIEHNYNKKISLELLADMCGMSQSHLRRLFFQEYGMSPIKYKNKLRTKQACHMLKSGILSVSEVSDALNFESVYLFSQTFKKEMGVSPRQYMQKYVNNPRKP